MTRKWVTKEDWWGLHTQLDIGGLTIKVRQLIGNPAYFHVYDDETLLVKGQHNDWTKCIQLAETATACILKARIKACPIKETVQNIA